LNGVLSLVWHGEDGDLVVDNGQIGHVGDKVAADKADSVGKSTEATREAERRDAEDEVALLAHGGGNGAEGEGVLGAALAKGDVARLEAAAGVDDRGEDSRWAKLSLVQCFDQTLGVADACGDALGQRLGVHGKVAGIDRGQATLEHQEVLKLAGADDGEEEGENGDDLHD